MLKRDEAMVALRRKWLPEFQRVLARGHRGARNPRRVSNAWQVMVSSQLPLVR